MICVNKIDVLQVDDLPEDRQVSRVVVGRVISLLKLYSPSLRVSQAPIQTI